VDPGVVGLITERAGGDPLDAAPARPPAAVLPDSDSWLVVRDLRKSYGGKLALAGVSFDVARGVTGVLGPNGAGKTTLMRCLAGISGWDTGRVVVRGIETESHPRAARRMVGFMPERVSFPSEGRVEPYLRFAAAAKGISRGGRQAAVDLAMSRAGLDHVRSRILGNLSKGYRQRVGLAQAMVGEPRLVILDEPSAGLDPLSVLDVRETLSAYASHHLVLLSTHTLTEARLLCDRLIVLGAGSIVYDGPTAGLAHDGHVREVRLLVRAGDDPAQFERLVGEAGSRLVRVSVRQDRCEAVVEVDGEEGTGTLARALVLAGWRILAIEPTSDALEEAFRKAVLGGGSTPQEGG
jgi:ABC-2 type transport system ATP-binding protein